jgi:hypothetical protein
VNLSAPKNAAIADGQGVGTIEDQHLPGITIADASLARPARGSKSMVFDLTLTVLPDAGKTVKVSYATEDLTAVQKVDYSPKKGKVTFKKGKTTAQIKVPVKASDIPGDRVFVVRLSTPVNATIVDGVAAGTIDG